MQLQREHVGSASDAALATALHSTAAAGNTPAFSTTLLDRNNFLSTELKASCSKQSLAVAVTGNLPLLITVMEPVIIFLI